MPTRRVGRAAPAPAVLAQLKGEKDVRKKSVSHGLGAVALHPHYNPVIRGWNAMSVIGKVVRQRFETGKVPCWELVVSAALRSKPAPADSWRPSSAESRNDSTSAWAAAC